MPALTDEQALLAEVIACPADDDIRNVYADWLEEHGQVERAELIRVQCALEECEYRGLHWTCPPPHCERCRPLRRRERELLISHWQSWLPGTPVPLSVDPDRLTARCRLDGHAADVECSFRRGFIAAVSLPLAAWCGGTCGRCGGDGLVSQGAFLSDHADVKCPACRGTGRLPGHGPRLVRACPLEVVRLTDREPANPFAGIDGFSWTKADDANSYNPSALPANLFNGLYACPPTGFQPDTCLFPTAAAAHAALSAACILQAKSVTPAAS